MCFLFSGVCSYKNVIGAHRASWRIISSIEQKEETRGNVDHVTAMKEYRSKIEGELSETCGGILKLLYEKLIPVAANGDSKPGAPETENFFPPNCCLVKKMTESKGNFEKTTNKQQKKDRNLLAFTGAATLLAVTVSFAISAINSRRKKSKKRDLPDSAVLVNLSASEILKLANRIIAKSKEVHDLVASIPLDKVTYANAIAPLVNLEAQQFPLIQSCVFPKLVSPFEDVRKASAEAERRIDGHFSTCSKREDVYRVVKAFAVLMSPETKHYVKCLVTDFERNGLNLTVTKREEAQCLRAQIDDLSLRYVRNLNDDCSYLLFNEIELVGLPVEYLKLKKEERRNTYKMRKLIALNEKQKLAEVTQRLTNAKEAASKPVGLHSHEDLARKLQEEMEKNRKASSGSKSDGSGRRMKEVACPTCTVHLQVQVPSSGSETIECGVCQHPFLVSAH